MSNVTYNKCDFCGNIIENFETTKGWIGFLHDTTIMVSEGKYNGKYYETKNLQITSEMHFCSESCFIKYLQKQEILSDKIIIIEKTDNNNQTSPQEIL